LLSAWRPITTLKSQYSTSRRHFSAIHCSSPVTEDVPPRRDRSIHGVPPSVAGLVHSRSVPLHPTSVTGLVHSRSIHTKC
jgi:hypothetical protein